MDTDRAKTSLSIFTPLIFMLRRHFFFPNAIFPVFLSIKIPQPEKGRKPKETKSEVLWERHRSLSNKKGL